MSTYLDSIIWNEDGLVPVIVQDITTNKVIMFAWMNNETLKQSIEKRKAIYFLDYVLSKENLRIYIANQKTRI